MFGLPDSLAPLNFLNYLKIIKVVSFSFLACPCYVKAPLVLYRNEKRIKIFWTVVLSSRNLFFLASMRNLLGVLILFLL